MDQHELLNRQRLREIRSSVDNLGKKTINSSNKCSSISQIE